MAYSLSSTKVSEFKPDSDFFTALLADLAAVRSLSSGMLSGSSAWDPGAIADGDEEALDIAVAGAALGDFVLVSFSLDVADLVLTAQVTASGVVTAQLANNTGGAVDLGAGTVYVRVIPRATFTAPPAPTATV